MIQALEHTRQKAEAQPFRIKQGHGGLWIVWEDFGCGIYKVVADFSRQDYAVDFVLGMIGQAEVGWPNPQP